MRVALQAAVGRRDVLGRARDRRLRHDRVGLRRLVNGFELQPLVVDPEIGRLQVFGVALVLVGAVGRLGRSSLPAGVPAEEKQQEEDEDEEEVIADNFSHLV